MNYFDASVRRVGRRRAAPSSGMNIGFGDLLPEELATDRTSSPTSRPMADEREAAARHHRREAAGTGKTHSSWGVSLRPEATGRERNEQVGGHHA
ncbi:MAG: hypothetical protein ACLTSX_01980 [Collinsella sp.]